MRILPSPCIVRAQFGLFELMKMPPPLTSKVASPCTQNDWFLSQSLAGARLTIAAPPSIGLYSDVLVRETASAAMVIFGMPTTLAKYVLMWDVIRTLMYSIFPAYGPLAGGLEMSTILFVPSLL